MQESDEQYSTRSAHDDHASLLPARGPLYAIIVGILSGILVMVINIALTLANTGAYQNAAREGGTISQTTALVIGGLLCLNFLIEILVFGFAGYIVGRAVVLRRFGFLAGTIGGALAYLASFLVRYIPNYPGNTATSGATNAATIGFTLIFVLVAAALAGLVAYFGARIATRKHPYYRVEA